MAAAGKRFEQLSGLPFVEQAKPKRNKTVMINGKEFRIGKRVKK
jgi:FAD synthase